MATSHTRPGWQRLALRRFAPTVVTVGIVGGAVVVATGGSQPQNAPLHFTASGSTAPVGNGNSNGNTDSSTGCNTNGNCVKSFGVKVGDVAGLYPGLATSIPVTYTNPNSFPIYVTTATATAAGTSACDGTNLVVGTKTMPAAGLLVDRNSSTISSMPVTLKSSTTDACKGATWTITVTAQAVK